MQHLRRDPCHPGENGHGTEDISALVNQHGLDAGEGHARTPVAQSRES